jgi:glycosyltransferase involved in cell wall biosynthesis
MMKHNHVKRLVVWGTYDLGKPRVRILLQGLHENGIMVVECHKNVWGDIEDKSQLSGIGNIMAFGLRWLVAYPRLLYRYLRLPDHDAVLVCYLGHLDILFLWAFTRLRGKRIIWDAFLSLYNTVVEDRGYIGRKHPLAFLLYGWEWICCRLSDRIVLDTAAHASYFIETYNLPEKKVGRVFVGAESSVFTYEADVVHTEKYSKGSEYTILFYGQFIPLHGIEYIVRAAKLCDEERIRWILIGTGQEDKYIQELIEKLQPHNLQRIEWVPYQELNKWIARANICLGIFGDTDKAARVIPNKVYQILATGKPLITRNSPAIRELLQPGPGIHLVPPANQQAIVKAIHKQRKSGDTIPTNEFRKLQNRISPKSVGLQFLQELNLLLRK